MAFRRSIGFMHVIIVSGRNIRNPELCSHAYAIHTFFCSSPNFYPKRPLERSKTDFVISRSADQFEPLTLPGMLPQGSPHRETPKPFFLTDLQLPHLENRKAAFRNATANRPRHHFVHPDWISEEMIVKRLKIEHRRNPLLYGWIWTCN